MITKPEDLFYKIMQNFVSDDRKLSNMNCSLDLKLLFYFMHHKNNANNEWKGTITDLKNVFYPNSTKTVRDTIIRTINNMVADQIIYKMIYDANGYPRAIDTDQFFKRKPLVGVILNPNCHFLGNSNKSDKIRTRLNTDFEIMAKQQHRGLI